MDDPHKRMSIAFDYLRMRLRQAGTDSQVVAEQVVQTLLAIAERTGKGR